MIVWKCLEKFELVTLIINIRDQYPSIFLSLTLCLLSLSFYEQLPFLLSLLCVQLKKQTFGAWYRWTGKATCSGPWQSLSMSPPALESTLIALLAMTDCQVQTVLCFQIDNNKKSGSTVSLSLWRAHNRKGCRCKKLPHQRQTTSPSQG